MRERPHLLLPGGLQEFARRKLRGLARKSLQLFRRITDLIKRSYVWPEPTGSLSKGYFKLPEDVFDGIPPLLPAKIVEHFHSGVFNILGSGWVKWTPDAPPVGTGGIKLQDQNHEQYSDGLYAGINAKNREESRRIQTVLGSILLDRFEFVPIDWHRDIKSGYRWRGDSWYLKNNPAPAKGADIKLPWELGRLQHLPSLALAYAQWCSSEESSRDNSLKDSPLVFQAHVLDFISANPPRFGPQWRSPMEVAIRAANILVAFDLFCAAGAEFCEEFNSILLRSIWEHGRHIVTHLEWHDLYRNNHYFGDIAGLVFIASYLPSTPETAAWLAFGVQELIAETKRQFLPDGGHFEATTGYQRFCGEMAAYATALVLGLPEEKLSLLKTYDHRLLKAPKPLAAAPMEFYPASDESGDSPFPPEHFQTLARLALFSKEIEKPDGTMPQIGDFDSGRFLKLVPRFGTVAGPTGQESIEENHLDSQHLRSACAGIITARGISPVGPLGTLESEIVHALAGNRRFSIEPEKSRSYCDLQTDDESFEILYSKIITLAQHRKTEIPLGDTFTDKFDETLTFSDFGLYILRTRHLYCSIRCVQLDRNHPLGHAHDDNLGIELSVGDENLITDPGSFVYTPLPDERNHYRSSDAHFVPRTVRGPFPKLDRLFSYHPVAYGRALYCGSRGFVGALSSAKWTIYRLVCIRKNTLEILDGCTPETVRLKSDVNSSTLTTRGYGIKTNRPVCSF